MSFAITMMPEYDPGWHHALICKKLEEVERGESRRVMVFMPPRHGKSQLTSIFFPAWFLGRNPKKEVISCSYNDEFAEGFGRKVRNIVKDNTYRAIFNTELSTDSKRMSRWNLKDGGGYLGAGVGGAITGRGADLFIIDDPIKNAEEANSPTYRQRVWDWYTSTAYTRLHPGAGLILILTRWHDDDLAGRILEKEPEKWDILSFPAIATEDETYRKKGQALWPGKYTLEMLDEIREQDSTVWASLYQQDPVISETQEFKPHWFKLPEKVPKLLRKMTTVDPAISQKRYADDSVVMTCGMDANGKIYILEYTNRKMNPTELITEIFRHKQNHNSEKVGIETVAYQKALIHFMKSEMKRRHTFINVQELKSSSSKESRIRALIPYYQNDMIFHNRDCKELEDQLTRFPSGRHDDIADALSMQLQVLAKPGSIVGRRLPQVKYDSLTGQVVGIEERIM